MVPKLNAWAAILWNGSDEDIATGEIHGPFVVDLAAAAYVRRKVLDNTSSHGIEWDRGAVVPVGDPVIVISNDAEVQDDA